MKLLYIVDPHLRGTSPRNRLDDYKAASFEKIREVFALARERRVKAIVTSGDNLDRPEVADGFKEDLADLLNESPVDIITTVGNHEIYGYNPDTYKRTSLRILERMCPRLQVVVDPAKAVILTDGPTIVALTFAPFSRQMDINGFGYDHNEKLPEPCYHIHVAHGMLLDHVPPFDRFSLLDDVKTKADMVLSGHDHTGYGVYNRADGKVFVNPGSITRIQASVAEIERPIRVAIIDVTAFEAYGGVTGYDAKVSLVPLKSAKPGPEVLDRSGIEADQKRAYAMAEFQALIQTEDGKAAVDIGDIIASIARQDKLPPEVVEKALAVIEAQRANVL